MAPSEMKKNLTASPNLLFLDGTYRLNAENYCFYAIVVRDRHGKDRPIILGFLSSVKAANVDAFFGTLKKCHTEWGRVQIVFVDKDFNEMAGIKRNVPAANILRCDWHVVTYMRKRGLKMFGVRRAPANVKFYDAVFSIANEQF